MQNISYIFEHTKYVRYIALASVVGVSYEHMSTVKKTATIYGDFQ